MKCFRFSYEVASSIWRWCFIFDLTVYITIRFSRRRTMHESVIFDQLGLSSICCIRIVPLKSGFIFEIKILLLDIFYFHFHYHSVNPGRLYFTNTPNIIHRIAFNQNQISSHAPLHLALTSQPETSRSRTSC